MGHLSDNRHQTDWHNTTVEVCRLAMTFRAIPRQTNPLPASGTLPQGGIRSETKIRLFFTGKRGQRMARNMHGDFAASARSTRAQSNPTDRKTRQ